MDEKIRRYSKIFEFIAASPTRSAINALLQKPFEFQISNGEDTETYSIYPPSLGATGLLLDLFFELGIDGERFEADPRTEALKVLKDPKKIALVCRFIALATFCRKEDLLDNAKVKERAEHFRFMAYPTDFCDVVLYIVYSIDVRNFIASIALMQNLQISELMPKKEPEKTVAIEK